MTQLLRTPDEAFDVVADFPYQPAYTTLAEGARMPTSSGSRRMAPVVLLHGGAVLCDGQRGPVASAWVIYTARIRSGTAGRVSGGRVCQCLAVTVDQHHYASQPLWSIDLHTVLDVVPLPLSELKARLRARQPRVTPAEVKARSKRGRSRTRPTPAGSA